MPSLLSYSLHTDAAPLEVSRTGAPSQATVYVLASNHHNRSVTWTTIDVTVPAGANAADLASSNASIAPETQAVPGGTPPAFARDPRTGAYRATPAAGGGTLRSGESLVLVLRKIPVNETEGLAVLTISETARGGDGNLKTGTRHAAQGVVKKAPSIPRDFRPDRTQVDNGDDIVLRWDGPDTLQYAIGLPDGSKTAIAPGAREWKPGPGTGPKRDTTYTLIATDPGTQREHHLTTTVQISRPTYETITATTGMHTPWIQGTNTNDGWITFPQTASTCIATVGSSGGRWRRIRRMSTA
ncbi:hypothetical protein GEV43_45850 [Actinomadura sp. J1-007]|uniref:hypothetical protein n=1 Tax=Actinomadura sp. J1-007 TaxID=2661913 RepID=UPI00132C9414|nr:hypothetical protein [Actinomadura sp. J1-007]MWK40538.1 hypothetical protein [Actinomadura sp. J1-007]